MVRILWGKGQEERFHECGAQGVLGIMIFSWSCIGKLGLRDGSMVFLHHFAEAIQLHIEVEQYHL